MRIAKFLKSAVLPEDYPDDTRPEIAFVGRSNSGKSTLLNAMCGGPKIAKVSGTPGKTRLLNFFDVGEHYRLVDLPGYGYAARDKGERNMWDKMIGDFFKIRENLVGILLLCDVRREWTDAEQTIMDIALAKDLGFTCVLTKIDKLGRGESIKLFENWLKTSKLPKDSFQPVSALKNDGVRGLEDYIFKAWVKPQLDEKS